MKSSSYSHLRTTATRAILTSTTSAKVPHITPAISIAQVSSRNVVSNTNLHNHPPHQYHFDFWYHEQVKLRDGLTVHLRLIQPSDHDLYAQGFHCLSSQSIYFRFNQWKKELTENEIQYFTNADQENHFALAATVVKQGQEVLVGVAEMFRSAHGKTAEPAIMVMDDAQGLGLGYLLLLRLISAARERGVESFESIVIRSNYRMLHLLKEIFSPNIEVKNLGCGQVSVSCKLPLVQIDESWEHMHAIDSNTEFISPKTIHQTCH